jgi:ketosteroid isomerase-like protein
MSSKADAVHEISNLIYGYAEALDRGDMPGVAAFFEHCTITVEGLPNRARGAAEVLEFFKPVQFYKGDAVAAQDDPDSVPATRHLTTNLIVHVADDLRTAQAKSYFTVIQGRSDFPQQPVIAGRYHDGFERVDGRWRFVTRHEFIDLVGDLSRHLTMYVPPK